jgi:hypothetical protein
MAQAVDDLPSKLEALSSIPSTAKKSPASYDRAEIENIIFHKLNTMPTSDCIRQHSLKICKSGESSWIPQGDSFSFCRGVSGPLMSTGIAICHLFSFR